MTKRKPGPPKGSRNAAKPPGEAHEVTIPVRCRKIEAEAYTIASKAAGISRSEWIRIHLSQPAGL